MKYFNNENNIYEKLILINLKLLILCSSLFIYKYVYSSRINQEASLKLFTILLVLIWIIKILNNNEYSFKKIRLNIPIFLFILLMSFSLLRSQSFMVSLNDYIIFLSYFFIYFLITNNVNDELQFNSLIKIFFITSLIIAIYALIQYYGFDPYLKELSAITSTIGQKNWVSNYLSLIFPIIFSYFLLENIKKNKLYYYLSLLIIYATLMICQSRGAWISIIFSILIAILLVYRFKLFEIFKKNKKWLIVLFFTFLIITVIYSTDNPLNKSAITVTERAVSTFDIQGSSLNARLLMWRTTFKMIKDNPLLGLGIGTFKINYLNYQADYLQKNPSYIRHISNAKESHNEYLQIGAELGLLGLGVFLYIIYIFYSLVMHFIEKKKNNIFKIKANGNKNTILDNSNYKIKTLNKNYYEDQDKKIIPKKENSNCSDHNKSKKIYLENQDKDIIIVFGLLMGITCFLFHSLFTFPLHVPVLGLNFFIIVGLTISYIRNSSPLKYEKNIIIKKEIFKNKKLKIFCIILVLFFMIFSIDSLVIRPYLAEIYYFKGIKNSDIKDYDASLYNLNYAAQLNPYNGRILHALGTTYCNLNIIDDDIEKILQNTKKYITDVNTYHNLGLFYSKIEEYKKAEDEFKQAIYLNPKISKGYHYLGFLYFSLEDYDSAIEQWNKILEIEPNFTNKYVVLNNLGIVYQKKQMPDKALEYFLEALQLAPEGSSIIEEIELEINKIYKSKLEN